MSIKLFSKAKDDITLSDAVQQCRGLLRDNSVAILYSPRACEFAKLNQEGGFEFSPEGSRIQIKQVYEARVFNEKAEMRWFSQDYSKTRAVFLSEDQSAVQEVAGWKEMTAIEANDTNSISYILWGTAPEEPGEWTMMAEARVGKLFVPCRVPRNKRVKINLAEYAAVVDNNGNVAVVEERLKGLEVYDD